MHVEPGLEASWPPSCVPTLRDSVPPPHALLAPCSPHPHPGRTASANCSSETEADSHTFSGERLCPVILSSSRAGLTRGQSPRGRVGARVRLGTGPLRGSVRGNQQIMVVKSAGKSFYSLCFICKIYFKGCLWRDSKDTYLVDSYHCQSASCRFSYYYEGFELRESRCWDMWKSQIIPVILILQGINNTFIYGVGKRQIHQNVWVVAVQMVMFLFTSL